MKKGRKDKTNILIVEKAGKDRDALESLLKQEYNCTFLDDVEEAIQAVARRKDKFQLILLGLEHEEAEGYELLKYMQSKSLQEELPVIALTKKPSRELVLKAYSHGVVDVFYKPYELEIVQKRIANVIRLYRTGDRDALTGGLNRKSFIREAENKIKAIADVTEYAMIFINIKNFKAVNELFGVEAGDLVLQSCYDELKKSELKPLVMGRLEADHFAALVKIKNLDFAKLTKRMDRTTLIKGKKIHLFSRFGVYYLEDKKTSVMQMLDRARLAKQNILDESVQPYAIYNPDIQSKYVDRAEALAEFEEGMENGEFKVYYQPVIDAATDQLVSAEALVRWEHPTKGFISPDAFIPALEQNGYITRLDRFMLHTVSKRLTDRIRDNHPIVPVSVNLSWMDFLDDTLMDDLVHLLEQQDISEEKIRLEVTETSYAALEQNRENLLDNLRLFGATILLDDFGSGYSSYGMLEKYDFDILKIDMSFIRKIEQNEKNRKIIKSIINLCHDIGIKVVAEGAETETQVQFLKDSNCDFIQGYYYSRPLSTDDFTELVDRYSREGKIFGAQPLRCAAAV